MATSIYVGNLSWSATRKASDRCSVLMATCIPSNLISDRETGRARGLALLKWTKPTPSTPSALDGKEFDGRNLRVNKAEPKKPAARRW